MELIKPVGRFLGKPKRTVEISAMRCAFVLNTTSVFVANYVRLTSGGRGTRIYFHFSFFFCIFGAEGFPVLLPSWEAKIKSLTIAWPAFYGANWPRGSSGSGWLAGWLRQLINIIVQFCII